MPRRTRIHIDGLPLHIVQRGHNRATCFFDDQDRRAYLGWLHEALVRERCRLHAYVLMTNHVHLLRCQRYVELNPVRAGMVGPRTPSLVQPPCQRARRGGHAADAARALPRTRR
jgi:hypothetical protein